MYNEKISHHYIYVYGGALCSLRPGPNGREPSVHRLAPVPLWRDSWHSCAGCGVDECRSADNCGDDGTQQETLVTTDQSRWDSGINVGVLGEFRLSQHFQFRVAPTMYFGSRHIVFRDLKTLDANGKPEESRQDMKSAYIACSADIIFAAPRFNNHRPYLMAGVSPMINLSSKTSDYLKLKRQTFALELGMGCDFYLPFFKLRPELKFVYALGNTLDTKHPQEIRDKNLLKYAQSASEAKTKMVVFSFYFE